MLLTLLNHSPETTTSVVDDPTYTPTETVIVTQSLVPSTTVTGVPTTTITGVATTNMTGVPTTSMTGIPTTTLTGIPTATASGVPTVNMTGVPTVNITSVPTYVPTTVQSVTSTMIVEHHYHTVEVTKSKSDSLNLLMILFALLNKQSTNPAQSNTSFQQFLGGSFGS